MIQQVLNKILITDLLTEIESELKRDLDGERRGGEETPLDDLTREQKLEVAEDALAGKTDLASLRGNAKEETVEEHEDSLKLDAESRSNTKTYIPQSPSISNLQSAIEEYFLEKRSEIIEAPEDRRTTEYPAGSALSVWTEYLDYDRRLLGSFEQTDIRWIAAKFAEGMRAFRGKHAFVDRPARKEAIAFGNNARIIVFGDWGSGVPRAQKLARCIRYFLDDGIRNNKEQHVIHLGDVYYAGWEFEYRDRFLDHWPVRDTEAGSIGSFTLNGNHDMYSGGHAYYDYALSDPRFKQWQGQSSLFSLRNDYWRLFGLDTSYENKSLAGDQVRWVINACEEEEKEREKEKRRIQRKTILLSHHQYCSAYETAPKRVVKQIGPLLEAVDIGAWFWGHEHRCMTYKNMPRIMFPRCFGHGGVPVYQTQGTQDPVRSPGEYEFRDYIDGGVELWAKFGFVVLDFAGPRIDLRYIDETYLDNGGGKPHFKEVIE